VLDKRKIIKYIKRKAYFIRDFLFYILISPLFVFLNIFKPIKIASLNIDRIGHLAYDTEIYLRRKQLGVIDKNLFTIFIPVPLKANIANKALYQIWKRYIFIIDSRCASTVLYSMYRFKSRYWLDTSVNSNEHYEFNNANPIIRLTEDENRIGYSILEKMGIGKKDWFVCIFARDNAYLKTLPHLSSIDMSYHDYRDSDIDEYIEAVKYIIGRGGFVIRLGKVVSKKMSFEHPYFIDCPFTEYRTDFMDIFLQNKAKFVIANTSGICEVAKIFDTPFCGVNIVPIDFAPAGKYNIYIPKKLKRKSDQKFVSLAEYFDLLDTKELDGKDAVCYFRTEFYSKENLEIVDNSSAEILDIVVEMNDRVDNIFQQTDEDIERQNKYALIHKRSYQCSIIYSPIGRDFLRQNEWFLN